MDVKKHLKIVLVFVALGIIIGTVWGHASPPPDYTEAAVTADLETH